MAGDCPKSLRSKESSRFPGNTELVISNITHTCQCPEAQSSFLNVICSSWHRPLLRSTGLYWRGHSGLVLCRQLYQMLKVTLNQKKHRGTWTDPEAHAPFWSQSSRPLGTWPCWEDVRRFGDLEGQSQLCSATRPLALWCVHSTVFLARKILGLLERIYGLYRFTRKLQTPQHVSSYHRTQKAADWMPTNFVLWSQTQTRPW